MTTTKRQPRTSVLVGSSALALAGAGVGLAICLSAGPAGAEPVLTGRSTTVVQPQGATTGAGAGRDTSGDATQCLPLLEPLSEDPSGPLTSPRPDPAPPVCNGGDTQTP